MLENSPHILSMEKYPIGEPKTTGKLCISSDPSGASIYIDGIIATNIQGEAKRTPSCIDVQEGRRDVVIRSDGYDDVVKYADIFPGRTTSIYANLKSGKPGKIVPFGLGLYILSKILL